MSQILKIRQPEPTTILVESTPVQDGIKLSKNQLSWKDMRGLSWIIMEDGF